MLQHHMRERNLGVVAILARVEKPGAKADEQRKHREYEVEKGADVAGINCNIRRPG